MDLIALSRLGGRHLVTLHLLLLLTGLGLGAGLSGASLWFGLAFIVLGAGVAAWSSRQYLRLLRTLTPAEFPPGYGARWGAWVNVVVAALAAGLAVMLYRAA